jgi:hypothetical protein
MMDRSDADKSREPDHLFIVRLWREVLDGGRGEWRGRIQHTGSGEVRYFRTWRALIKFIVTTLGSSAKDEHRDER